MDRTKSLDELERHVWGEPTFSSYLVRTCYELRRKPIGEFSVEDLRIMIGQGIGVPCLVPLAVEILIREPLAEGDFYPGDLLKSVIGVDEAFWSEHAGLARDLTEVLRTQTRLPEVVAKLVANFIERHAPR